MKNEMLKFKHKLGLLLIFVLALLISGCAPEGSKPISEMTQKERLVIILGTYNSQYSDYMRVTGYTKDINGDWKKISSPELTDNQKNILGEKKKILTELYPLITLYDSYENSGLIVNADTESQIFSLLDSLILLIPD